MRANGSSSAWVAAALTVLPTLLMVLLILPSAVVATHAVGRTNGPSTLVGHTLVKAPPPGAKGPDDLSLLAVDGLNEGGAVLWTAYQNGVNPDGTPGTTGGPAASTVAGYDPVSGKLVKAINVTGKVDGLVADPAMGTLLATVNEDLKSAFDVVYPALGAVATYTYSPSPAVNGNGGTDSIAVKGDDIFVAHSNPNDTSQAADYRVQLDRATLTAHLTPVFFDDSVATDVVSGASVTLSLTDPDTNLILPAATPHFAGQLATIGQADGKIVFASHLGGTVRLHVLNLTDNKSGNIPPTDGLAVATCGEGTLFVVDAGAGAISSFSTTGWARGTVFIGEPKDNGNPLVGTLNLGTGQITSLGNHFVSPKGLLFVPSGSGCGGGHEHDRGDGHAHDGDGGDRHDEVTSRWMGRAEV